MLCVPLLKKQALHKYAGGTITPDENRRFWEGVEIWIQERPNLLPNVYLPDLREIRVSRGDLLAYAERTGERPLFLFPTISRKKVPPRAETTKTHWGTLKPRIQKIAVTIEKGRRVSTWKDIIEHPKITSLSRDPKFNGNKTPSDDTLIKWAKEGGVKFSPGRPKKHSK